MLSMSVLQLCSYYFRLTAAVQPQHFCCRTSVAALLPMRFSRDIHTAVPLRLRYAPGTAFLSLRYYRASLPLRTVI